MAKRYVLVKSVVVGLSILTSLFIALSLIGWDIHQSLYSFVWDYQLVRIYALISISLFITINSFRLIESIILKTGRSTIASNLSGLYGYIIGTIVYIIYFQLIHDYSWRSFGLAIPIVLTAIGFNFHETSKDKMQTKRRLLILFNIVILIALSVTVLNLYISLQYDRDSLEEGRNYSKKLEQRYFSHGDSLARAFYSDDSNLKLIDRLENDTLKRIVIEQMKLHEELLEYRESRNYMTSDYLWNYEEMIEMIAIGLIFVILWNIIYMINLYRS